MRDKLLAVVIIIFFLWSMAPTWYELANRDRLPEIRSFELIHNFPTDYNFYLSRIREGLEGRLTVIERYTSEPHNGSFIHVFYLALGWIGRFVRVPLERVDMVYHVARVVFGATLLLLVAAYARKSFGSGRWSLLAWLLVVTASTWPKLVAFDNNQIVPVTLSSIASWRFGGYMPWWSVMDSLQRITFIPHLLVGQALIVFLLLAIANESTMKKGMNWIFLGGLAFALGIIFPPGLLFVSVTVIVMVFLQFIFKTGIHGWRHILSYAGPRGLVLAMGMPALLYLSLMTSFYPWKRLAEFDILHPLPFNYSEYFLAVGYVLPLGLLGLLIAFIRRDKNFLAPVSWVISWLLLLGIFRFVPQQSPLRFSEMMPHVPLAVLAAYLFFQLHSLVVSGNALFGDSPRGKQRHQADTRASLNEDSTPESVPGFWVPLRRIFSAPHNGSPARRLLALFTFHFSLFTPIALIAIGLGVMYSSLLWQRDFIDHKMRATYPYVPTGSYVMYPLKDFIDAIAFIGKTTSRDRVILSETTAGNYLPAYAGNTVYVGHDNTVNAEAKQARVATFFSGTMTPQEARDWLTRERLSVIFYGPQEREDLPAGRQAAGVNELTSVYPFLEAVYTNKFVTIYAVR